MKKIICISIITFLTLNLYGQYASQWRGENRDGIYHESGLLKEWPDSGPELLWHYDELGDGHTSATVIDDMVFTAGEIDETGYIFAFDHNGSLLWKTAYGEEWTESYPGARATPLYHEGNLYTLSSFGRLACLDATSGDINWTVDVLNSYDGRNIKWGITENLLIDGEKLFCTPGGVNANVIALNKNTGELIWKSKGNGEKSAYCSPQLVNHNGRHIFVTMTESHIIGLDAANGRLLWKHYQPNQYSVHANTPLYHNGSLYCLSGYGKGGVMLGISDDGESVEEIWRNSTLDSRLGGVVLINGRIYGSGDKSRTWICLDWESGEELYTSKELTKGSIISAGGMLYWYSQGGQVALVEPGDNEFRIISTFDVPYGSMQHWAHPVIYDKKLYIRHGNSLMVYSIAAQ